MRIGNDGDRTLAPTSRSMSEDQGDHGELGGQEERDAQAAQDGDDQDVDEEGGAEAQQPRAAPDPGQPSAAMIAEHNLTHIPYRSWCECCVRGKDKRRPSRKLCGAYSNSDNARVRMDYAYLTENVEGTDEEEIGDKGSSMQRAETSLTMLVMQESQCRSVWAYAVEHKGSREDWIAHQVVEDLETVGLRNDRVVLKSDQEPAVTDLLKDIARRRESEYGTALEQSKVGESNSNSSVERAIQDVEGQARTLRAALEMRIRRKVKLKDTVVPWLVRHAACLITRCRMRENGKTAMTMMKGRQSHATIAEFGEHVLFKIPKTKLTPGKFEDQWDSGMYIGFDMRSTESLIATPVGVFRVTDIVRKPDDERWSADLVFNMSGSPKQPVPGQLYRRTPAFARKFGSDEPGAEPEFAAPIPMPQADIRNWRITKRDIDEYGPSPGYPGCNAVVRGLATRAAHTPACRLRFQELILDSEEGQARVERAAERATKGDSAAQVAEPAQQGGGDKHAGTRGPEDRLPAPSRPGVPVAAAPAPVHPPDPEGFAAG